MKIKQKIALFLSCVLTFNMLMCCPLSAFALDTTHSDVNLSEDALKTWQEKGYIKGYSNGSMQLDRPITKAEFVALINRVQNYTNQGEAITSYTDIKSTDWYYKDAAIALEQGYIHGTSKTTLSLGQQLTRAHVMVILENISKASGNVDLTKLADANAIPQWAKKSAATVLAQGFMTAENAKLYPERVVTRKEAVSILNRYINNERNISLAGNYNLSTVNKVNILAGDVKLSNTVVNKDLMIMHNVNSVVDLSQVTIKGRAICESKNAKIIFNGKNVSVDKENNIVFGGVKTNDQAVKYVDGEYIGSSNGYNGKIKVKVTIKDGLIAELAIVETNDDGPYIATAEERVFSEVKESQSTDVSAVSGATYSRDGIVNAIKDALSQASGKTTKEGESDYASEEGAKKKDSRNKVKSTVKNEKNFNDLKDGTYTGTANGYYKESIAVKVVVKDGKVSSIVMTKNTDDRKYFDWDDAKKITTSIIEKQSTKNVDSVAGASYSSVGLINAVANALEKAKSDVKTINENYDGKNETVGNVIITKSNVVVKNLNITGSLTLADTIGEGDVTLENVMVKGKTYIYGGGENSVHLKDCKFEDDINADKKAKTPMRIVIEGTTTVAKMILKSSVIVESEGKAFVDELLITNDISDDNTITLKGHIKNVKIDTVHGKVMVEENTVVEKLILPIFTNTENANEYTHHQGLKVVFKKAFAKEKVEKNKQQIADETAPKKPEKNEKNFGDLKDGTYTGTANGYYKESIAVKVVVKDGKVSSIVMTKNADDKAYFDADDAKKIIASIIEKQSTKNVDSVSGASYSSVGLINAVANALEKAKSDVKTINENYDGKNETVANVIIAKPNLVVKNLNITGSLTLADTIGEGDVTLENVTVKGKTYIYGGGENSIHFKNCKFEDDINADKKAKSPVRIVIEGTTTVAKIILKSSVIVESEGKAFVDELLITNDIKDDNTVTLKGNIEKVKIDTVHGKVIIEENAVVAKLILPVFINTDNANEYKHHQGLTVTLKVALAKEKVEKNKNKIADEKAPEEPEEPDDNLANVKMADGEFEGLANSVHYLAENRKNYVSINVKDNKIVNVRITNFNDDGGGYRKDADKLLPYIVKEQDPNIIKEWIRKIDKTTEQIQSVSPDKYVDKAKEVLGQVDDDLKYDLEHSHYVRTAVVNYYSKKENIPADAVSGATNSKKSLINAFNNAISNAKRKTLGQEVNILEIKKAADFKTLYNVGDTVDLSTLKAIIVNKDNSEKTIGYSEFKENDIVVNLKNGHKFEKYSVYGTDLIITHEPSNTSFRYRLILKSDTELQQISKILYKFETQTEYTEHPMKDDDNFAVDLVLDTIPVGKKMQFKLINLKGQEIVLKAGADTYNNVTEDFTAFIDIDAVAEKALGNNYKFTTYRLHVKSKAEADKDTVVADASILAGNVITKNTYVVGDQIDYSGLVVQLKNKSGDVLYTVNYRDFNAYGIGLYPTQYTELTEAFRKNQRYYVRYKGKDYKINLPIVIKEKQDTDPGDSNDQPVEDIGLGKIKLMSSNAKTEYTDGEKLDLKNVIVMLYDKNNKKLKNDDRFSWIVDIGNFKAKWEALENVGFKMKLSDGTVVKDIDNTVLNAGVTYVEISHGEVSAKYDITVANEDIGLGKIKLMSSNAKTEYTDGEKLDLKNVIVMLYDKNNKKLKNDDRFSWIVDIGNFKAKWEALENVGFEMKLSDGTVVKDIDNTVLNPGITYVEISRDNISAKYDITVANENIGLGKIKLMSSNAKTEYTDGEKLDLKNVIVMLYDKNNKKLKNDDRFSWIVDIGNFKAKWEALENVGFEMKLSDGTVVEDIDNTVLKSGITYVEISRDDISAKFDITVSGGASTTTSAAISLNVVSAMPFEDKATNTENKVANDVLIKEFYARLEDCMFNKVQI